MLLSDARTGGVFVQGELVNRKPTLHEPANSFHIFCSSNNPGAIELAQELADIMHLTFHANLVRKQPKSRRPRTRRRRRNATLLDTLHVATDIATLCRCDHMLVYLNDLTWTRGEQGSEQFAADVHKAMDAGIHILLAHEMVGVGQDERHPCDFDSFFACDRGTTPQQLLQRGIYSSIAVPLKGLEWRQVSMVMLEHAVGAQGDFSEEKVEESFLNEASLSWIRRRNSVQGAVRYMRNKLSLVRRKGASDVTVTTTQQVQVQVQVADSVEMSAAAIHCEQAALHDAAAAQLEARLRSVSLSAAAESEGADNPETHEWLVLST
jgi:hypothetical protein